MDIEQGSRVVFNIRGTDLNYWKKHKSTRENVQETNKPLSDLKSKINTNAVKSGLDDFLPEKTYYSLDAFFCG